MITFFRSHLELMALTESRDCKIKFLNNDHLYIENIDSGQKKRYLRSLESQKVKLPHIPKLIKEKWIHNKKSISKFLDNLEDNIEVKSSYDLILLERQNNRNIHDVA